MKGKDTSRICRVCLRTDRYLGDINSALSKFHYELCLFYSSEIYNSRFCAECEHMLKRVYNFKEKCKKAAKLYHDFMHNFLPDQTSLKNINELHKLMPESTLGHWMPANSKIFSYEEGVDTEFDEIDNIEISGEIKQRSLKTYWKPKYTKEKIQHIKKINLYKERRMRAAKQWAENKAIPAKTPFEVYETDTVPNVNLQVKTPPKLIVANTELNKKVVQDPISVLSKTPSKLIVENTEFNKKVIPISPNPISVISNQTKAYNTSDTDDDNDYEDSIVIADPLTVPFKDDIPNTPKPKPITKECSVVITPLRIFRPVTTPNILKKRSVNTPLTTIQEVVSSNKMLSQNLPKYLITDGTEPLLKGGKINVPGNLAGNGNSVPNKASLLKTSNIVTVLAKNINKYINLVPNKASQLKTTNTANVQEKYVSQNSVTTISLLKADAQKNTPSTNMPVKMLKGKNTTLNATTVQKRNTVLKKAPGKIPIQINTILTTVQKVNTTSKPPPENYLTEPNTDASGFKIEYPKITVQDLLSSKPNSEVVIEESEVKTHPATPNIKIIYDPKSELINRKLIGENTIQLISRKRPPSSNLSLSSNGDVIYEEKTQNSNVNESNQSTNDNVKRIKMNQQDSTQTVKNIGSNDPNTIDDANTTKESEVKDETVKKVKGQQVPVQKGKVSSFRLRKEDKVLVVYTKERLKAALMIKFASCGELKSKDIVIDKQFVMECLDRRVPETVLRRLWRHVLRDVKGRSDSKMNFSPDTLRTFRVVQKRYMNEKLYQEVFDIQYLTTEQEVLEEFQMRKYYPCFINATYKCHICYHVFKFLGLWENHVKCHDEKAGDFPCEVCSIRFSTERSLVDHMDSHKAVFKCKRCTLVTYRWNAMVNHYNQHIGTEYKCKPCGTSFKSISTYNTHMATMLHGRVVCISCGRNFHTQSGLKQHRKLRHKNEMLPENGASVQCDECPLAFPSQEVLLTHKKYSHESYVIRERAKSYTRSTLNYLDCRVCGVKAKNFTWLTHHFRKQHPAEILDLVYSDIKSHLCHHCGHGCTNPKSLKDHIQRHAASNRPREVICNICQRKFLSQKGLRHHLMTHNRVFKCNLCSKDFLRKGYLVKHLRSVHKLTESEAETYAIAVKKEHSRITDEKREGKTKWGKNGIEENTACGNDGKEEDTAWGNYGKEENTACSNDGREEDTAWGDDGVEENTECGNDGEASATEEVAEETEAWATEEEIVEDTVWGTEIQAEDIPVWVTEVQIEEEVAAESEEEE